MFAELHARSAFSFLEGGSSPEAMVARAAELGYKAIAITDRGGFYGSARAHYVAKEVGVRALVGTTISHGDGSVPVLCATRTGYQRMCRQITTMNLFPSEFREAEDCGDGHLIALTGDRDGPVAKALQRRDKTAAEAAARSLIERFGRGNVFMELWHHGRRDDLIMIRSLPEVHYIRHLGVEFSQFLDGGIFLHRIVLSRMKSDRLLEAPAPYVGEEGRQCFAGLPCPCPPIGNIT
jgi:error-prone DNA polymerase